MTTMTKTRFERGTVSRTPYSTSARTKSVPQEEAGSGTWFIILLAILFGAGFLVIGAVTYGLLLG